jgi:hypothetical protein
VSLDSRQKGARGEREWAGILRAHFPDRVFRRNIQSRGGGAEAADVTGLPGWHAEVKRVEKLNIWSALQQAESDAKPGERPYVAFRRNRSGWYVALPAPLFLALLAANAVQEKGIKDDAA